MFRVYRFLSLLVATAGAVAVTGAADPTMVYVAMDSPQTISQPIVNPSSQLQWDIQVTDNSTALAIACNSWDGVGEVYVTVNSPNRVVQWGARCAGPVAVLGTSASVFVTAFDNGQGANLELLVSASTVLDLSVGSGQVQLGPMVGTGRSSSFVIPANQGGSVVVDCPYCSSSSVSAWVGGIADRTLSTQWPLSPPNILAFGEGGAVVVMEPQAAQLGITVSVVPLVTLTGPSNWTSVQASVEDSSGIADVVIEASQPAQSIAIQCSQLTGGSTTTISLYRFDVLSYRVLTMTWPNCAGKWLINSDAPYSTRYLARLASPNLGAQMKFDAMPLAVLPYPTASMIKFEATTTSRVAVAWPSRQQGQFVCPVVDSPGGSAIAYPQNEKSFNCGNTTAVFAPLVDLRLGPDGGSIQVVFAGLGSPTDPATVMLREAALVPSLNSGWTYLDTPDHGDRGSTSSVVVSTGTFADAASVVQWSDQADLVKGSSAHHITVGGNVRLISTFTVPALFYAMEPYYNQDIGFWFIGRAQSININGNLSLALNRTAEKQRLVALVPEDRVLSIQSSEQSGGQMRAYKSLDDFKNGDTPVVIGASGDQVQLTDLWVVVIDIDGETTATLTFELAPPPAPAPTPPPAPAPTPTPTPFTPVPWALVLGVVGAAVAVVVGVVLWRRCCPKGHLYVLNRCCGRASGESGPSYGLMAAPGLHGAGTPAFDPEAPDPDDTEWPVSSCERSTQCQSAAGNPLLCGACFVINLRLWCRPWSASRTVLLGMREELMPLLGRSLAIAALALLAWYVAGWILALAIYVVARSALRSAIFAWRASVGLRSRVEVLSCAVFGMAMSCLLWCGVAGLWSYSIVLFGEFETTKDEDTAIALVQLFWIGMMACFVAFQVMAAAVMSISFRIQNLLDTSASTRVRSGGATSAPEPHHERYQLDDSQDAHHEADTGVAGGVASPVSPE